MKTFSKCSETPKTFCLEKKTRMCVCVGVHACGLLKLTCCQNYNMLSRYLSFLFVENVCAPPSPYNFLAIRLKKYKHVEYHRSMTQYSFENTSNSSNLLSFRVFFNFMQTSTLRLVQFSS